MQPHIRRRSNDLHKNFSSNSRLHRAVQKSDAETVQALINEGADVNEINFHGHTPLHTAIMANADPKILDLLLNAKAKVNLKSSRGFTPLQYALQKSNLETTIKLVEAGAHINTKGIKSHGKTALHLAIERNDEPVVKRLLTLGADIHVKNNNGLTAFKCALEHEYFGMLKILMKVNVNTPNQMRLTLLMEALEFYPSFSCTTYDDYENAVAFLLKCTDINVTDDYGENVLTVSFFEEKIVLKHLAFLKVLGLPIHQSIHNTMSYDSRFTHFFTSCIEELKLIEKTKFSNSWVTFFDLLVGGRRKLKNYAGNEELIRDFEASGCLKRFPIYGASIEKNVRKGLRRRGFFDASSFVLSDCLPIFKPSHLIIRDILDHFSTKNLSTLDTAV